MSKTYKRKTDYIIHTETDPSRLQFKIRYDMEHGWDIWGPTRANTCGDFNHMYVLFSQAMVKYEEECGGEP